MLARGRDSVGDAAVARLNRAAGALRQRLDVAPLATGYWALSTRYGTTLVVLLGLMAMLLAVACANLAGLTLARSLTRRHQVAVRLALGGSAARVFWQLLLDGILLSAVAFAGAVPLAWGIVRAVEGSLMPASSFRGFRTWTPDTRVLAVTALLTLVIGLPWASFRVAVGRGPVDERLRRGEGGAGRSAFGRGLLVAQVALSMTCLVGSDSSRPRWLALRAKRYSLHRSASSSTAPIASRRS